MKKFCNQTALFDSWRRCAQAGLSPDAVDKLYPLGVEEIRLLRQDHRLEIEAFRQTAPALALPGDAASFLMDAQGVLLEKKHGHEAVGAVPSGLFLCGKTRRGERGFPCAHVG